MNNILQKRIEEVAKNLINYNLVDLGDLVNQYDLRRMLIEMGVKTLQNQWISVEEALPTENRIIARLSESFCGTKDCIEVLHFCERYGLTSPEGYYDLCGENVPTNAITHWMHIPSLKGGEE